MIHPDKLLEILQLERIDTRLYRGTTIDVGSPIVYGGQVLAQALNAATRTVPEDRIAHSLHGYFILPGDKTKPIIYEVDTIRDGGSFTTRRVVAVQNGKAIFNMATSFQRQEEGLTHQIEMPKVPSPEELPTYPEVYEKYLGKTGMKARGIYIKDHPIDVRPVEDFNPFAPGHQPPKRHLWFRLKNKIAEDSSLHREVMTYFSDFNLLTSALLPHDFSFFNQKIQIASLDHAMWFHRNFNLNEWMLYSIDSPNAGGGRGFCTGHIFSQDGKLVASVTQEGLIRLKGEKKVKS